MSLLCVCFLGIVPYLMGLLLNHIMRERNIGQIETYLSGFLFLFLCQGLLFFAGISGNSPFHLTTVIQTVFYILCGCLLLLLKRKNIANVLRWNRKTENLVTIKSKTKNLVAKNLVAKIPVTKNPVTKSEKVTFFVLLTVFLGAIYRILQTRSFSASDTVLETIQTTLATDSMYRYHPLTGNLMELGMITSKKWITLPLWYGYLANTFNVEPALLIYALMPAAILLVSCFSYGRLAYLLFDQNKQKTMQFVIVYLLLILSGDYITTTFGYRQLFCGYSGETITASVMIPYVLTVLYEAFGSYLREENQRIPDRRQRIRLIEKLVLAFSASIFLTSIPTGVFFLLLVLILFSFVVLISVVRRKVPCK